jgi:PAS domain S-box-containing protein
MTADPPDRHARRHRAEAPAPAANGEQGSAALFSAAFKHSRNAMALLDERRRLTDVNGAYLKLLGYRRDEVLGEPMDRFVVGRPQYTPAEWRKALRGGSASGEAHLEAADGSQLAVQWAATVAVVAGRRVVLMVALSASRWGRSFRRTPAPSGDLPLTSREREVVELVASGDTGPEIAESLHLSPHTVRHHVRNAMDKLGARSRAHLVAKAFSEGLIRDRSAKTGPPKKAGARRGD